MSIRRNLTSGKKLLLVGGIATALAVPVGAAVAATAAPSPSPSAPGTAQPGPDYGRMMGGYGDPDDCPFHDSATATKWRDSRGQRQQLSPAERQKLAQQHRAAMHGMWATTAP